MSPEKADYIKRNAAILRRYRKGDRQAGIARRFGMTSSRVSEIIGRFEYADRVRAELVARHGERPVVEVLPDDTSIEVLALFRVKIHGWAVRLSHLKYDEPAIATLGDLRDVTDAQLLLIPNVGKRLVTALRRYCPARPR